MIKITDVAGYIPTTQKKYRIRVKGRNVLIVGGNGCGKTSLLTQLHEYLEQQVSRGYFANEASMRDNIQNMLTNISNYPEHAASYRESIQTIRQNIRSQRKNCIAKIPHTKELHELIKQNKGVIKFFPANRQSEIKNVNAASGSKKEIGALHANYKYGSDFEEHLVNLRVRAALDYENNNKTKRKLEIEDWFKSFDQSLQFLFEDKSVHLTFEPDHLRYMISQAGRPDFAFQSLSSGYSAIFGIYADLLIRSEYHSITPKELTGIVLIDEIDAHLHISLQRKIFPFFEQSFPNIQFIVTTHSPFVVASLDDAVIYDLSSGTQEINLSMYSMEAIVEGLLGVPSISKKLEDKITTLIELTNQAKFDVPRAKSILNNIAPYQDSLDDESKMYFEIAKQKILLSQPRKI